MRIQRQITSILSTMLVTGMFLTVPLRAQQSSSQTPAQTTQQATQPQQQNQPDTAQPAQTSPGQQTTQPPATTPAAPAGQNQSQQPNQQQATPPSGTTVNPSEAPLAPVTTYPDASGTQQQQQQPGAATAPAQTNLPEGPQPKKPSEPVGAATAESVPTTGGAAAKPAGVAIAPAKQHQTRSWLIKVGAIVAAGAAVGTVYALSRGTSSTPPGANSPGAVPRSGAVPK
jgi:hypothetical protein